jgi:hypothetical protein
MPVTFNGVTPVAGTVARWELYEAVIDITATYTNPYDYSDIAIQATLTSPTGVQHTVDAFWMENFTISSGNLTDDGTAGFKLRFTPNEQGQWSYILSVILQGGTATTSPAYSFICSGISANNKGFIRKTNTNYLQWDNGAQYIPVGEDLCWSSGEGFITYYQDKLAKLQRVGANFIRVWMANWTLSLEWTNSGPNGSPEYNGLKQYRQSAAKELDWLLEQGYAQDFAVMLCINYHNQVSTNSKDGEWDYNPYNSAQNGPCDTPLDFFSNSTAKEIFKNRLRYIVARWGYAGCLQSWELFNEVDNTDYYYTIENCVVKVDNRAIIAQWHDEMAAYLKSLDSNHLVTSSCGSETNGNGIWQSTHIDFTQIHKYKDDPRLPRLLANLNQQRLETYNKPVLDGEFGMANLADDEPGTDPHGIGLHNVIWATLLSGSMGSAAPWWEHWVDEQDLYSHFSNLSAFKDVVPFVSGNYQKVVATYFNTNPVDLTITPAGNWPCAGDPVPPTADFILDNEGEITPDVDQLFQFIWASGNNSANRMPPTFHVNYLEDGNFRVITAKGNAVAPSGANVSISVDGVELLNETAQPNTFYTVPVTAGPHIIKVENPGADWVQIAEYVFFNAVGPLNLYTLKSADNNSVAGYVQYRLYNHQYLAGNTPPPVIPAGAILNVPGMNDGVYTVNFYSCATATNKTAAQPIETRMATAVNGVLTFSLPAIAWDLAYTVTPAANAPAALSTAVSVTPTQGWSATTAPVFTVDNNGITPGASSLGLFIYGSQANTQYRNPATFVVNYAQQGHFQVHTTNDISSGSPRITTYVDGVKALDEAAAANTTYTVSIPSGLHSIMADNLGGDWVEVDQYSFNF